MIKVDQLTFSYGKKQLFKKLSFTAKTGNIYGLLGKNGAGKTTLLKLLSGQLRPDKGELTVKGYVPRRREPEFLSKVIYVPEKFYLPSITVDTYKNIYGVFYPDFDEEYFHFCLNEFNVETNKKLNTLSYGQQKKFLLSFAFASMCPLVLMDEPTNGLDIPSKKEFRKVLINAINESRLIIISTHQVRDLENLIDPVIILDKGKIIFNHSFEEVGNCLSIFQTRDRCLAEASLYYEQSLNGYTVITDKGINENTEEQIDIESLFNFVISNPDKIQSSFNRRE